MKGVFLRVGPQREAGSSQSKGGSSECYKVCSQREGGSFEYYKVCSQREGGSSECYRVVSQSEGGSCKYNGETLESVKGRLKLKVKYWQEVLQATPPIVSILKQEYILPFLRVPEGKTFSNQISAIKNKKFVSQAVRELTIDGRLREVQEPPTVCSPLLVVTNRVGKQRLVLNLKYGNKFLRKEKFKYEDIRTGLLYFGRDEYLCTFDLKSGYHHVDIHITSQQYLGCEWKGKHYVFTVLPFGLSTACYVFTKLMRPLVRWWRGQGIKVVMYIDDGIVVMPQRQRADEASKIMQSSLGAAGFLVNAQKSHWDPEHKGTWLGFDIDLNKGVIAIPERKIVELLSLLKAAKNDKILSAKAIASIVGRIIAMGIGIGPVARLLTRFLYRLIVNSMSWYERIELDSDALNELQFWYSSNGSFNGQSIWRHASAVRMVYSDASSTGYGGYVLEHGQHVAHGQWTTTEMAKSSTWWELAEVANILRAVANRLANYRVCWFTDNQNVVRIVNTGSRVARNSYRHFQGSFQIPGQVRTGMDTTRRNILADYYSRLIDRDDWAINPTIFEFLDSMWGPHTVDRFDNSRNAQLARFNSRYWNPGTEAVDTFTVDWYGENNWWCPPVCLIPTVIEHARVCKASGKLIVPHWVSSPFWPLLCPSGTGFDQMFIAVVQLPRSNDLIVPSLSGASLFKGQQGPNTDVLALCVQCW